MKGGRGGDGIKGGNKGRGSMGQILVGYKGRDRIGTVSISFWKAMSVNTFFKSDEQVFG